MPVLYITSDRPVAGKTALASALAVQLSRPDREVGYFKPFSSDSREDKDVAFVNQSVLPGQGDASQPQSQALPLPEGAAGGRPIPENTARELRLSLERLTAAKGLVLAEGPSLSPSGGGATSIPSVSPALAELLDARVLLIVHYRPDLDVEGVMEACEPFGQRLLGVVINVVTRYKERGIRLGLAPAMESRGVKFLGAIPEDRLMLSVTVGQIAEHLNGRAVFGEEKSQELVENFLIGGNIMDQGSTYFGRMENKAVIVRGDRPDIQLAALSTPTTCLVLTGGHEPIQYVYYQAEREEVPLLVVQSDTLSTAHALNTVLERSSVHHPGKLDRFQELISEHLDMAAIQAA